jgi:predicted lipoprotein with Yx(FWY)xxD motif
MSRFDTKHRENQRTHALRRLYQRHGLAMGLKEYAALCEQIAAGTHPSLGAARRGGTLHTIRHRGKTVVAVFSPDTACVVTFLPAGTPIELRGQ